VTETEAEWDDNERAWAIALKQVEADTCPGCGEPRSESTHRDAEGGYEVDLPIICNACTPLNKARDRYAEAGMDRGLFFEVKRTW
jgi:hypothetical protein